MPPFCCLSQPLGHFPYRPTQIIVVGNKSPPPSTQPRIQPEEIYMKIDRILGGLVSLGMVSALAMPRP